MHSRTPGIRSARRLTVMALAGAVLLAACDSKPAWHGSEPSKGARDTAPDITVSQPTNGATNVPTGTEIVFKVTGDAASTVELAEAGGAAIKGATFPGGSSWLPAEQLKYGTQYTAKVTATVKGKQQTETVSFTTMAKPSSLLRVSSVIGDGQVVGVGMPLILTFTGGDVPKDKRAEVQRRLFVKTDPPQEGSWNWFSGHEIHFRPKEYWEADTSLSLRAALGGLPIGGDRYCGNDLTVDASVGKKLIMKVDNATKQMTVSQDNQILKVLPVSLGKPDSPSSSGKMIVMEKKKEEWFDSSTYGVPADSADGYRTKVAFTQRLTLGGEFIHAAPWSESDQGQRNVSHGCTNISAANAEWLFGITRVGDPVIVVGTEKSLTWADGFTDWNISFDEYTKGSAIPYSPTGSRQPSPSAS